ncbi:hypothetical protein ACF9IK_00500 [Kitasatospora hibisci]|uniref:hypothetical protein n=1 Tax=Kitasatospora hibisci TaxID=3369522 RepID=UPI003754A1BF
MAPPARTCDAVTAPSEQRLDDGAIERESTLGEIPGIPWMPALGSLHRGPCRTGRARGD